MVRANWWMMTALVAMFASCGNDTVKNAPPSSTDCPAGERWNPILARCDANGTNGAPNNTATNNTATNNVTPNNATTNNVANNSTNNPTNNSTVPTNNTTLACGTGDLIGKTCAPSGEPLAAADVTVSGIDCATGMPFEVTTRTMSDGTFELNDIPSGQHQLKVETGSFNSMRPVIIQKDMTTDLTSAADKVCLDQSVEIAVITGAYDHVEGVLGTLNLTFTVVGSDAFDDTATEAFLTSLPAMNAYDIIFINCGDLYDNLEAFDFSGQTMTTIAANLRAYVQGGKSVYISDWAAPFIEKAFPDMIDFVGDDTRVRDHRDGYAPQTINASVLTPELQSVLGRNDAVIEFPQDALNGVINNNWAVAAGVGMGAVVQLEGDALLCAQGGAFTPCPSTDGSQPAAPLLITYTDPSGGAVVFTSFHNERQTTLNQDMERILRFLIFQL